MLNELGSNIHHHWVKSSHISLDGECTLSINGDKLHWHVLSWDSYLIKGAPSIIFAVVANLWAKITTLNTLKWHPGVQVSYLNEEWHDSIVIIFDNQPCKNHSMRAEISQITWPPLCGCKWWGMNDKLICFLVKGSSGLDSLNIRPMANFCLSICSHDFHLLLEWLPLFPLLVGHHVPNSERKHSVVEDTHVLAEMSIAPNSLVALVLFKPLALLV